MATVAAPVLAVAPGPSDVEAEVIGAFDARQKLQEAISDLEVKRKKAELDFVQSFTRIPGASINVEDAFQRYGTWNAANEQAKQRIAALMSIRSKVADRFDQLKSENPEAAKSALKKKIEALKSGLAEPTKRSEEINQQIASLQDEIASLSNKQQATATKRARKAAVRKAGKKRAR
jgi:chromosome segregation ATPase